MRIFKLVSFLFLVCILSMTANASTITVNSTTRSVSALGSLFNSPTIGSDYKQETNNSLGYWEKQVEVIENVADILYDPGYIAVASANSYQKSNITFNGGILNLTASEPYPSKNGHARASVTILDYPLDLTYIYSESDVDINIDFTVDGTANYSYDAFAYLSVGNFNYDAVPQIRASLVNKDTNLDVFRYNNYEWSTSSNELASGNYAFNFNLLAFAEPTLWIELSHLNFSVTPVDGDNLPPEQSLPEPSTMLLLCSGLVGLIVYGRKRMKM